MTLSSSAVRDIKVIRGRKPDAHEKEFRELMNYESGEADVAASQIAGAHQEPWLNVIDASEPASLPGWAKIVKIDDVRRRIQGAVLDVGAGTCWLSAKVSRLPDVRSVFALDLSEKFLRTAGVRVLNHFDADLSKMTFVVSDFNDIPLPSNSVDCGFLWAAIHHSLSPIKTIQEVGRCLKPGGSLIIFEGAFSVFDIARARKGMLALSSEVTEIAYTRAEIEYLIANAKIGPCHAIPIDWANSSPARRIVRRMLRALQVEQYVRPPCYAFIVEKRA